MQQVKATESNHFLNGWKEVANYLGKGVRTVQRYERALGLPVYRASGRSGGSVSATKAALDAWLSASQSPILSSIDRDRMNRVGADFLCIDAEVALTFSGLALASNDPVKKSRRAETARKAYGTIMQLRRNVDLSDEQRERLNASLERLKSELQSIGYMF